MEVKKTEKADLTNKSGFFFSIGLAITMALVLMAFEWTDKEEGALDLIGKNTNTFEETMGHARLARNAGVARLR